MSNYSAIITWVYFVIYFILLFTTSIICAIKTKQSYDIIFKSPSNATEKVVINTDDIKEQNEEETALKHTSSEIQIEEANAYENDMRSTATQQSDNTPLKGSKKCKWMIKHWAKMLWLKKKIYLSILPHLFDQATDVGVIIQYHQYINDEDINQYIDPRDLFTLSICILFIHRIISGFGVWVITKNKWNVLLQLFDVLILRSVWTNYKLNLNEPTTTQRFLGVLEATFEAMPQLFVSMVFITKTGRFEPIIMLSLMSSFWSLTSRVSADDKSVFAEKWKSAQFSYKSCPLINWRYVCRIGLRFLEISSRATLLWVNLGGTAMCVIIVSECVFLIIVCYRSHSVLPMGNMMYFVWDNGANLGFHSSIFGTGLKLFMIYRFISTYIYLILISIFATSDKHHIRYNQTMQWTFGCFLFVYCWITHFIWPCGGYYLVTNSFDDDIFEKSENLSTARDLQSLVDSGRYLEVIELLEFGYVIMNEKDHRYIESALLKAVLDENSKIDLSIVQTAYKTLTHSIQSLDILNTYDEGRTMQYRIIWTIHIAYVVAWGYKPVSLMEYLVMEKAIQRDYECSKLMSAEYKKELTDWLGDKKSLKNDLSLIKEFICGEKLDTTPNLLSDIVDEMILNETVAITTVDDCVLVYGFLGIRLRNKNISEETHSKLVAAMPNIQDLSQETNDVSPVVNEKLQTLKQELLEST